MYLSRYPVGVDYHDDPDKYVANQRGEMFTVGDISYLDDDGYLFLCDRQADVIVSGGVNINRLRSSRRCSCTGSG